MENRDLVCSSGYVSLLFDDANIFFYGNSPQCAQLSLNNPQVAALFREVVLRKVMMTTMATMMTIQVHGSANSEGC